MTVYPDLNCQAWHDPRRFSIVDALEKEFDDIRKEAIAIAETNYQPEVEPLKRDGLRTVFLLYENGRKNLANCARCPTTTQVIESHSAVRTFAGLAYFSKMAPATHIRAHRGPTNLRTRCHLGIEIPAGNCAIRVGKETRQWKEGKCLVFDDCFEHEAWNHSTKARLVLVVDLWHPDLSSREIQLITGLHRRSTYRKGRCYRNLRYRARNDLVKIGHALFIAESLGRWDGDGVASPP